MKYTCGACGRKGHNVRSCGKKSTRTNRSKKKRGSRKRRKAAKSKAVKRKAPRLTVAAKAALKKIFDFSSARNFLLGLNAKYAGSTPAIRALLSKKLIRARYKYGQRYLLPTAKGRQTVRTNPLRRNARLRRVGIERSYRSHTRHCEAAGCLSATREGKQYCSNHVELHPYVQILLDRLAEKEAEDEDVRQKGAEQVEPYGLTSKELLNFLKQKGTLSVPRLSRSLQLELNVVKAYVRGLAKLGLVTVRRGSRSEMVSLVSRRRRRYF